MQVTVLDHDEALATLSSKQASSFVSFGDTFGTTGCLISCGLRRRSEFEVEAVARETSRQAKAKRNQWKSELSLNSQFTLPGLAESAKSGCGSCDVTLRLFRAMTASGVRIEQDDQIRRLDEYWSFEIENQQGEFKQRIQLYNPHGMKNVLSCCTDWTGTHST